MAIDWKKEGLCALSEFVGTFLLVFTVCNQAFNDAGAWGGVCIACSLMTSMYALNAVSGANFNPAVSLALAVTKNLEPLSMAFYMVAQLAGGAAASFACKAVNGSAFDLDLGPKKGFSLYQALTAESAYTMMLCFVFLNVAIAKENQPNQYYGLAISFVVVAGAYAAGNISGGCFNPAVAFGIDASNYFENWKDALLPYILSEFAGALLAAGAYHVLRKSDVDKLQKQVFGESLGTFFLVLTLGLNFLTQSEAVAFSVAASLMSMFYALASLSGAHFNPAVTLAICLSGRDKCSWNQGMAYMGGQIVAGILAGFVYSYVAGNGVLDLNEVGGDVSMLQVAVAEITSTFVLAFVFLSVATVKSPLTEYAGLAIASCVTTGGFAFGMSGGSMNPAVSFGIGTPHFQIVPILLYTSFELAGGALAAGLFRVIRPEEYEKVYEPLVEPPKPPPVFKDKSCTGCLG